MKRLPLLGLVLVIGRVGLVGLAAGVFTIHHVETTLDTDDPAEEDVEETIIEEGMPVPGIGGVGEMIVGSEMPVPSVEGEGAEEMVVGPEMPVPGLEGVEEMIVEEQK